MGVPIYKETDIKLSDLILDDSNPRFAQLYSGNSQDDIIHYLLEEEDAKDLARKIVARGFFRPDKRLWVLKQANGKYLVKDGNRRCAAVRALQEPLKYSLPQSMRFETLPVIIYENKKLLDDLIKEEHTAPSIKDWSTIAKALEVYRLSQNRADESELTSIDSDPARLLRIANFYNEAVKIGKDCLKELLRNSGPKGGKLTIFERLFALSESCGYKFSNKANSYSILITDKSLFNKYVNAIVKYLQDNPSTTYYLVNKIEDQKKFLQQLGILGNKEDTPQNPTTGGSPASDPSPPINTPPTATPTSPPVGGGGTKPPRPSKPIAPKNRASNLFPGLNVVRNIPVSLQNVLSEGQRICFTNVQNKGYPNAAMALLRMAFESTLDLILKETLYGGSALEKRQGLTPETFLSSKKNKFANAIKNKTNRTKMQQLDLETANNIIHGTWSPTNKDIIEYASRVEELINWMLMEKSDFEIDLDLSKLK